MLRYRTTVRVYFSLEDYYNRGITPEQAREIIENIRINGDYLYCYPAGINQNWAVEVRNDSEVLETLNLVGYELEMALKRAKVCV